MIDYVRIYKEGAPVALFRPLERGRFEGLRDAREVVYRADGRRLRAVIAYPRPSGSIP